MNARTPLHVAIIMDGNGRWAAAHGKPRIAGHRAGADVAMDVAEWCRDAGVKHLTLYAFSTENWKRSKMEVSALMRLFGAFLDRRGDRLVQDRVRFRVVGRRSDLSPSLVRRIESLERKTERFEEFNLMLAVSYGGRVEIAEAARRYAEDVAAGRADASRAPDDDTFRRYLYAPDVPDPDLVIRTSGEFRLSNFLLWQCAYSEFWATPVLWPDFSRADLDQALDAYAKRERRMGGRLK